MIESLKKDFSNNAGIVSLNDPKGRVVKICTPFYDKNLRGYDATLYDLFKYPFVSYDVDACKNGSSARKQNIHDFLLVLSLVLLKTLFFSKVDVFIMHWQNPKRK